MEIYNVMILIEVLQRIPNVDKHLTLKIPLTTIGYSSPGFVRVGNLVKWVATVNDQNEGEITLVIVEHDEALDPDINDVQITRHKNYVVVTSVGTIIQEIISEMNNYHN
jgi:hypothetical protein